MPLLFTLPVTVQVPIKQAQDVHGAELARGQHCFTVCMEAAALVGLAAFF